MKRGLLVFVFIVLLAVSFYVNFLKPTGFAVNDADFTPNITVNEDQKFLVSLDIPPYQQKIKAGQNLLLEVDIRVPGGSIDQTSIVDLEYSIRDLSGNIISSKVESGAIAVKESDVTGLLVPSNTKSGVYTAFVKVNYSGDIYEAAKTFEVTNSYNLNLKLVIYILAGLIVLLLLFIIIKKIRNRYSY